MNIIQRLRVWEGVDLEEGEGEGEGADKKFFSSLPCPPPLSFCSTRPSLLS